MQPRNHPAVLSVEEPFLFMTEECKASQVKHQEHFFFNIYYERMFIRNVFLQVGVSQNFLLADLLWLQKIPKYPHVLAHVNIKCSDHRYPKLKTCISELILNCYEYVAVAYIMHDMTRITDYLSLRGYTEFLNR